MIITILILIMLIIINVLSTSSTSIAVTTAPTGKSVAFQRDKVTKGMSQLDHMDKTLRAQAGHDSDEEDR